MRNLMSLYPFQLFRHRVYLPFIHLKGWFGDFKRGVKTQKIFELKALGLDPMLGERFETISYHHLDTYCLYGRKLGFDKFLDIGVGLGRSLIVAKENGFVDTYGIDVSSYLIDKCRQNLNIYGVKSKLTKTDVKNYQLPSGPLVVYLFNPFGEERMAQLVKKITERRYSTLVIYHNPKHNNVFDKGKKINEFIWPHFGLFEERCFCYLYPGSS